MVEKLSPCKIAAIEGSTSLVLLSLPPSSVACLQVTRRGCKYYIIKIARIYRRVRVCRYGDAGDVVGMVSVVHGKRRNGVLWWCARGVMYVCSGSVVVV